MVLWLVHTRTSFVIGNKKLFNIITTKLLETIYICQALESFMLKALVSDHSLLFHHVVAYKSPFP